MMFWSHQIVAASGFVAYTDVATNGDWSPTLSFWIALALVQFGAALPDIDTPDSTFGSRVRFISYPISMFFGHRGITHSFVMLGVLYGLGLYLDWPLLYWLVVGVALHFIGDFLTDSGIPLLWPLKQRFRFVVVGSSNGISEPIMVSLFLAACAVTIGYF